jgi:peptidoglycan L-alanyl-D-glutamate endopeptidase CwlK
VPGFKLGQLSKSRLVGVDDRLIDVAVRALEISDYDATILIGGGVRSKEQARDNVARGVGIANSRHLTGDAIDLVALTDGKVDWSNLEAFRGVAKAVKRAAAELMIPIRQGCDWNCNGVWGETKEWDWPHFENPRKAFLDAAIAEMKRYRQELWINV